jgi:hypothetical protein
MSAYRPYDDGSQMWGFLLAESHEVHDQSAIPIPIAIGMSPKQGRSTIPAWTDIPGDQISPEIFDHVNWY